MTNRPAGNGHRFRKAAAACLAASDLCHLCGHGGARTVDHIISIDEWFRLFGTYDGVDHPSNLAPAHGQRGREANPCPTCDRLCNQARGARSLSTTPQHRSRDW